MSLLATIEGREVTDVDAIWLGRMVDGEAGRSPEPAEAHALVSALIRRWVWLDVRRGGARSLGEFARSFSQPISPLWDQSTDQRCQQYPASCTPARLARRAAISNLAWSEVSVVGRATVLGILGGDPLSGYPAINWAASSLYRSHGYDPRQPQTAAAAVPHRDGADHFWVPVRGVSPASVFSCSERYRSSAEVMVASSAAAPLRATAIGMPLAVFALVLFLGLVIR